MRFLMLLLAVSFLPLCIAAQQSNSDEAQPIPPADAATQSGPKYSLTTVVGCMSSSRGTYSLGTESGDLYRLAGDKSFLRRHVGQQVRLTGIPSAAENISNEATSNAAELSTAAPVLTVSKIEKLADTCGRGR